MAAAAAAARTAPRVAVRRDGEETLFRNGMLRCWGAGMLGSDHHQRRRRHHHLHFSVRGGRPAPRNYYYDYYVLAATEGVFFPLTPACRPFLPSEVHLYQGSDVTTHSLPHAATHLDRHHRHRHRHRHTVTCPSHTPGSLHPEPSPKQEGGALINT
ncbi:hypothetical protein E2C01_095433 [Portunus trituberculatus]|uniref:Uncharacterized protein n=1 Tax=Portunus trituberculatus TaxID=210409 RepID=A0A5B7K065_PORTR|nr:hypothetical protein [Portunus trituberculatus]